MVLQEWFCEEIEEKRGIKLPRSLIKQDYLKELERLIKVRNTVGLNNFYSNFTDIINLDGILNIKEDINNKEEVREEDKLLISKIVSIKGNDWEYLFDIVGNLTHNAILIDELNEFENIPIGIKITTKLWIFLSYLELMTKLFSEYLKIYVDEKIDDKKNKKNFFKAFQNGGHPTMGELVNILKKLNILHKGKDKNSFFIKNKVIRNKIAHNNIYFDKEENSLYFTSGEKYSIEQFEQDLLYLRNFLLELIYQMNKNNEDIQETVKTGFKKIGNAFLRIGRDPRLKVAFENVVFEWEKK